jgi:hypothetical protein
VFASYLIAYRYKCAGSTSFFGQKVVSLGCNLHFDGSYGAELEFPCPLLGPVFEPAQYPTMYELSLVPNAKFDVNIIPGIDKMRITNISLIIIIFQSPNLHPYD